MMIEEPLPPSVFCRRCRIELAPTQDEFDRWNAGEDIYCSAECLARCPKECEGCDAGAPFGECDSCGKFGHLRAVRYGPGNSIGDGRFCLSYESCGQTAKRSA